MYNVFAVKYISLLYRFGCLMATFGLMISLKTVCIKGFTSVPQTMSQNLVNTRKLYDPLVELCGSLYNGVFSLKLSIAMSWGVFAIVETINQGVRYNH